MEIPKVFLYLLVIVTCLSICAGMITIITVDDKFNGVFLDSYGKTLDMVSFLKEGNEGYDLFINFLRGLNLNNVVKFEDLNVNLYKDSDGYITTDGTKQTYKFCPIEISGSQ